jgi:hypothetical protein
LYRPVEENGYYLAGPWRDEAEGPVLCLGASQGPDPRSKLVVFPGVKAVPVIAAPEKCAEEVLRFIAETEE